MWRPVLLSSGFAWPQFLFVLNFYQIALPFSILFFTKELFFCRRTGSADFAVVQKVYMQGVWWWCRRGRTSFTAVAAVLSLCIQADFVVPCLALCKHWRTRHTLHWIHTVHMIAKLSSFQGYILLERLMDFPQYLDLEVQFLKPVVGFRVTW